MSSVIFSLGFVVLLFFGCYLVLTLRNEKLLTYWPSRALLAVPFIASVSYLLMALKIGVISVDDRVVYITRYIDWMITTPLLLYVLLSIGMLKHRHFRTFLVFIVLADILMILFGLLASLQLSSQQGLYFASSFLFFFLVVVLLIIVRSYTGIQSKEVISLYKNLLILLLLTWFAYPLIWYVHQSVLTEYASVTEPALYLLLDVFTKGVFSFLIVSESETFRRAVS